MPLVIAHRGGAHLGPENTLEAARAGHAAGADLWELDVQLTRDGVPVLLHDDTLRRTTNAARVFPDRAPWRLGDFTLAEIATLEAGSSWLRERGEEAERDPAVPRETLDRCRRGLVRIPTLEEALRLTRDLAWRVNVELKTPPPGRLGLLVPKVLEEVRRCGMVERTVISSFDHAACRAVALSPPPRPRVQVLTGERLALPHRYVRELVGGDDLNPSFNVLGFGGVDEAAGDPEARVVIARLREAGVGVNVWTVNDPRGWEALCDAGVSGIITDRPHALKAWLLERKRGAAAGEATGAKPEGE